MNKITRVLLLCILSLELGAQSTDSLRFYQLLQPSDTLKFNKIYEGIFGESPELTMNQRIKASKLSKEFILMDSLPEHRLYLYTDGGGNATGIREFLLSFQSGDTALTTSFKTELPASFTNFEVVTEGLHPVVQLDYVEYLSTSTGSTEMDVASYFMIDGFCLPLARVIRKLWLSENGNYEPNCKDYQYFSVEFSRDISFRAGELNLKRGHYKFSENLNCESVSRSKEIPSASYKISDYLVLKH